MKNKTRFLIISVIIFLIALIIIQFLWIHRAAVSQEKKFEYTVVAALNKAITELNKQDAVCLQITNCFNAKGLSCCNKGDLSYDKWNFINSIITAELKHSKICIEYELQLSTTPHPHSMLENTETRHKCFTVKSSMLTTNQENIWLHITFPMRNKFIFAQIGWLFISSVILIFLTIIAFILIYTYYRQEQILAKDTRNFINNLTHEFKTPISSIRLANNRIIRAYKTKQNTEAYTSIINQENIKLENQVNYLLDISRLQKGKIPMKCEPVNLHEVISQQSDSFKLRIEDEKGSLQLNLIAENYMVCVDVFHIANAITNILDNACKYSPDKPEITITTSNKNGYIVVAIADKGLGIDKVDRKTIFQEFSRVNTGNIHNVKGFGLGLSYVWQIIKMHKGTLTLDSKKGEGSTFYIQIPISNNGKN